MAKATIANPNPSIFTSDPIEQIYAKGTVDRDMSGLSGLLLWGAQQKRAEDEDKYLGSLSESNKMSERLARMQEAMEYNKERMKQAVILAKDNFMPSGLKGLEDLVSDYKDADANAMLGRDLIRSQINRNNMPKGSGGGGGGKDQITFELDPLTGRVIPKIVTRGGDLSNQLDRGTGAVDKLRGGANNPDNALDKRREEVKRQLNEGFRRNYPNGQQ